MKLKIDDDFKNLIPPLSQDEYEQLEHSCIYEGIREPIIFWHEEGIIVDGHNRYDIAQKNDITYQTLPKFFRSKEEAMVWMIDNQRGRRNMSKQALLELGWKRAELLEEKAKENQLSGLKHGDKGPVFQKSENREPINTTAEAAKFAGVSTDTASKYKKVMTEAPEEIKEDVRTGKKSINRAYQEMRGKGEKKEEKQQEIEAQQIKSETDELSRLADDCISYVINQCQHVSGNTYSTLIRMIIQALKESM